MSFFDNLLGYITDGTRRLSTRATVVILTLIFLIFADNIIGFTHYYNNQRKLEQLESIANLLKDPNISESTKTQLKELEYSTFKRQDIIDQSSSFLKNIEWTSSNASQNKINNSGKIIRNNLWFLLSTSGIYILITIILVPVMLITDKQTAFLKLLASMFIFSVIMFFTSWFNYWLFDKIIPDQLFGNWTWNYIINFLLQVGLIIGLIFTSKTIEK